MSTRQRKQNVPAKVMTKTSFAIPESLHDDLKIEAVKERRDMKDLVADAIAAYLGKKQRPEARDSS